MLRKSSIAAVVLFLVSTGPAIAGECRDPWITQAIREVTGRDPNGSYESGECTYTQYNNGSWSSYGELKGYVQSRLGGGYAVSRGDFGPSISMSEYNALPKWSGNGQSWAFYNGSWCRILTNNGGTLQLLTDNGGAITVKQGSN